ncbi:MAG: isopentenyl-diphosphate Delta-isomerase [Eggerthellaceae bacterium]|nr:isopentenyl-diphosphate Delta-isomerase [Eggerthellaceae bacterium]
MCEQENAEGAVEMEDELILVDGLDRPVGSAPKLQAHAEGLLHRAFSVVLVREDGAGGVELLLSRRAEGKYHSGGLWANSCCSHPRVGEEVPAAAMRRVREELGCGIAPGTLRELGTYVYRAVFANGLVEYEYDHVLLARIDAAAGEEDAALAPDPSEVGETRWISPTALAAELTERPGAFAAWAPGVLAMVLRELTDPAEAADPTD